MTASHASPCPASADAVDRSEDLPAGHGLLDENGYILEVNHPLAALLGATPGQLARQAFGHFVLADDQDFFERFHRRLFDSGEPQACELRICRTDGAIRWLHLAAVLSQEACTAPTGRIVASDFTPYKETEHFLRRLAVLLAQVNQAVVCYRERRELFREVCRAAVEHGRIRLAWIGLVDAATGQLQPVAHAGHEEGYLQAIHVNVKPGSAFSQDPSAQAILRNRIVVAFDSDANGAASPWRHEALKRGYRASVAVPFQLDGRPIGAFNLHVDAPAFRSAEELDLLRRIGATLSFALDGFELEDRRQRAEAALRDSEAQNRAFIRAIPDLIFLNRRDGEYLAVHAPAPELLAAPPDVVLHRKVGDLLPKPVAARCLKAIAAALDAHALKKLTYSLPLHGRPHRFEARIAPCTFDTVLTIVRDITELQPPRKKPRRKKTHRA